MEGVRKNEQISLREIIIFLQEIGVIVRKFFLYIVISGLLFGIAGLIFAIVKMPLYKAELRFVVKSEGVGSGMSGMLSGLGAVLGGNTMGSRKGKI
jgi:uncharacterized protein involved in exopolysaccharide biosynthesis